MEKQKLLWVSLSIVAVLTLFTLAAFLLYPRAIEEDISQVTETEEKKDFDYIDYTKGRDQFPGLGKKSQEEAATPGFSVVLGEQEQSEDSDATEKQQENTETTKTTETTEKETEQTNTKRSKTETKVKVKTLAEAPRQKYSKQQNSASSINQTKKISSASSSRKRSTTSSRNVEYWIQVASLSSMTSASSTVNQLREKGFNAKLFHFTKENGLERSFYRVRIGPYAKKDEAKQFLSWVKQIDDYKGSYITEVYSQKNL